MAGSLTFRGHLIHLGTRWVPTPPAGPHTTWFPVPPLQASLLPAAPRAASGSVLKAFVYSQLLGSKHAFGKTLRARTTSRCLWESLPRAEP